MSKATWSFNGMTAVVPAYEFCMRRPRELLSRRADLLIHTQASPPQARHQGLSPLRGAVVRGARPPAAGRGLGCAGGAARSRARQSPAANRRRDGRLLSRPPVDAIARAAPTTRRPQEVAGATRRVQTRARSARPARPARRLARPGCAALLACPQASS